MFDRFSNEFQPELEDKINTSLKDLTIRSIVEKSVVNSFRLDGDLICIATTKGFLVLNENYEILKKLLYR